MPPLDSHMHLQLSICFSHIFIACCQTPDNDEIVLEIEKAQGYSFGRPMIGVQHRMPNDLKSVH